MNARPRAASLTPSVGGPEGMGAAHRAQTAPFPGHLPGDGPAYGARGAPSMAAPGARADAPRPPRHGGTPHVHHHRATDPGDHISVGSSAPPGQDSRDLGRELAPVFCPLGVVRHGLWNEGLSTGYTVFMPALRVVHWPHKFWPEIPVKFGGKTNPTYFLQIYVTAMRAAGADEEIMANWFALARKDEALSWL